MEYLKNKCHCLHRLPVKPHSNILSITSEAEFEQYSKMVQANLNFYLDPQEGGHAYFSVGTAGSYRRKFDQHAVNITDVKGQEQDFTLEAHGFQFCKQALEEKTFEDEDVIKSTVYSETESLIKEL